MIGLDTSTRHARSPQASFGRRFRWALTPVVLAALSACGGGEVVDSKATGQGSAQVEEEGDAGPRDASAQAKAPAKFSHPGIFMSQTRLDTFKASANSPSNSGIKTGYAVVLADSRSNYTYAHQALTTVEVVGSARGPQESRFKNDAMAAYLNTLRWVKTNDVRHRDKAVAILNDWAVQFRGFTVASGTNAAQVQLEAAWMLPVWISAAEILRHHGGGLGNWPAAEVARFNGFVDRLYTETAKAQSRVNNWAVSAALGMMATGVFQDNPTRYAAGLTRLIEMIPVSIYGNGEINELKARDCWHPQYNLIGIAQAAEMASIQGDNSVWMHKPNAKDALPRLAMGLEYMAKSLNNGSGVRDCRSYHTESGYTELALNGYVSRGVAIPNFQSYVRSHGPDQGGYEFLGWTTATHGTDTSGATPPPPPPAPSPSPAPTPSPAPSPAPAPSPSPAPAPAPAPNCAAWSEGKTFNIGTVVSYQGKTYKALVTHTAWAGAGWNPASTPTLWTPTSAGCGAST
ncbi:carbohydrate-binding protein [Mitsuaria sp. 7]|uniref:carbohydrate-binding protein n=1 Tax=Mitsuaria sp. 7 TaxID=1658665 RepID=UPI00082A938D|nr:carbohydrate-binding protein [Mitsuaria sp. 7]